MLRSLPIAGLRTSDALWAGDGLVTVADTTFSRNSPDDGPVIFQGEAGVVTLKNVIFADNTTADEFSALACHATFDGGNIQWPDQKHDGKPDTSAPTASSSRPNGGTTPTMAIAAPASAPNTGSAGCRVRAPATPEPANTSPAPRPRRGLDGRTSLAPCAATAPLERALTQPDAVLRSPPHFSRREHGS